VDLTKSRAVSFVRNASAHRITTRSNLTEARGCTPGTRRSKPFAAAPLEMLQQALSPLGYLITGATSVVITTIRV
jgi:hypothetical protein